MPADIFNELFGDGYGRCEEEDCPCQNMHNSADIKRAHEAQDMEAN